jgi:hypothetical protein
VWYETSQLFVAEELLIVHVFEDLLAVRERDVCYRRSDGGDKATDPISYPSAMHGQHVRIVDAAT